MLNGSPLFESPEMFRFDVFFESRNGEGVQLMSVTNQITFRIQHEDVFQFFVVVLLKVGTFGNETVGSGLDRCSERNEF